MSRQGMRVCTLLLICCGPCRPADSGVLEKLKSGLQFAGKILGLDKASEVAKLVTEGFAHGRNENAGDKENVFSGFFKLLGLKQSKLDAIVVNIILFIGQLISTSLTRQSDEYKTDRIRVGTPLEWILKDSNERVSDLLRATADPNLAIKVINDIRDKSDDQNTDCVQLLMCKLTPVIKSMQDALKKKRAPSTPATGLAAMLECLPDVDTMRENSDECDTQYRTCFLH